MVWRTTDMEVIDRDGEHADRGVVGALISLGLVVERDGRLRLTRSGRAALRAS